MFRQAQLICVNGATVAELHLTRALPPLQALYAMAAIGSPWQPGETRQVYFRSWWAATASAAQMAAIPYK